jgi:hypothetical protein
MTSLLRCAATPWPLVAGAGFDAWSRARCGACFRYRPRQGRVGVAWHDLEMSDLDLPWPRRRH